MDSLTMRLRLKLRSEGIDEVEVEANEVLNPKGGQLAAVYSMTFPPSLSNERKNRIQKIAQDECAKYIQTHYTAQ
jgi:hypothetical protein